MTTLFPSRSPHHVPTHTSSANSRIKMSHDVPNRIMEGTNNNLRGDWNPGPSWGPSSSPPSSDYTSNVAVLIFFLVAAGIMLLVLSYIVIKQCINGIRDDEAEIHYQQQRHHHRRHHHHQSTIQRLQEERKQFVTRELPTKPYGTLRKEREQGRDDASEKTADSSRHSLDSQDERIDEELRISITLGKNRESCDGSCFVDVDLDDTDSTCSSLEEEESSENGPDCAICLTSFHDTQIVCQSNNPSCQHLFHAPCMTHWLLKHEECPVCRQNYLLITV